MFNRLNREIHIKIKAVKVVLVQKLDILEAADARVLEPREVIERKKVSLLLNEQANPMRNLRDLKASHCRLD